MIENFIRYYNTRRVQRKLWDYMRLHPEVTEFSTLAKRTGLSRNTVKKHYGVVAAMLGRK